MRALVVGAVAAVALLLGASGCASSAITDPVSVASHWTLSAARDAQGDIALVADAPVTLDIVGTQVSGSAACNHYGGSLAATATSWRTSDIVVTEMGCPDARSDVERRYLAAFGAASSVAVDGDRLELTGPGIELDYTRVANAPTGAASGLVGPEWHLVSFTRTHGATMSSSSIPAATVAFDGARMVVHACDTWMAPYSSAARTVTPSGVTVTEAVPCPAPPPATAGKDAVVSYSDVATLLQSPFEATVIDGVLTIADAGASATFTG